MVPSDQPGRRTGSGYYIDKQPAGATRLRSSRWMPTPKQLMALKEMYQRGITTPTAQQIRLVTAQLRNFGRIEGKNVFYWFQNHRARERQKRRRQLMSMYQSVDNKQQQQQQEEVTFNHNTVNGFEDKESAEGVTKSSLEVEQQSLEDEQQNNWKLPNISSVLSDQAASSILQERMMSMEYSNSSRQIVEQSGSLRPMTSDTKAFRVDTNPLDFHHYYRYDYDAVLTAPVIYMREEERRRETQTLELFPLKSENLKGAKDTKPICRTTSNSKTLQISWQKTSLASLKESRQHITRNRSLTGICMTEYVSSL